MVVSLEHRPDPDSSEAALPVVGLYTTTYQVYAKLLGFPGAILVVGLEQGLNRDL